MIFPFILFLLVGLGCSNISVINTVPNLYEYQTTPTPFQPSKSMFAQRVQYTSTPLPLTFSEVISLNSPVIVEIGEEYKEYLRDLDIIECKGCTTTEINTILGSAKVERWIAVRDWDANTDVLYIHSSEQSWGLHLGEILVRLDKDDTLKDLSICFNNACYEVADIISLERAEIKGGVTPDQLFEEIPGQVIILTCSENMIRGLQTPKLIVQLTPH